MVFNLCQKWLRLVVLVVALANVGLALHAADDPAHEAIKEAITILEARKSQSTKKAEQDKIAEAIAAMQKLLAVSKDVPAQVEITPAVLKEKFQGKGVYNVKTGVLILTYDFSSKEQLKDFDAKGNKPVVSKGAVNLEAGEAIQHNVMWKTLTLNAKCGNRGGNIDYIKMTGGVRFLIYGDHTALQVPRPSGGPTEALEVRLAPGTVWPVELKVFENRAALKVGNISIGHAAKQPAAGNVELHGGMKGNFFGSLIMEGTPDEGWVKRFFAP